MAAQKEPKKKITAMSMGMEQDELNEILEEFFTEAEENLDKLEQDLIQLEALADGGATDPETVNRIFRVLHTLKGGAGFLGLEKMAKLAHAGENLLDEIRNDKVAVSKPVMDALLQTNDVLKNLLAGQKAKQDDSHVDNSALIAALEALAEGKVTEVEAVAVEPVAAQRLAPGAITLDDVMNDPALHPSKDKGEDGPVKPKVEAVVPVVDVAPASAEGVVPAGAHVNADLLADVLNDPVLHPSRDKGEDGPVVLRPAAEVAPVAAATSVSPQVGPLLAREAPPVEEKRAVAGEDRRQGADERRAQPRRGDDGGGETIRVETARLDKVMNLVGELVLARNTLVRQLHLPHVKDTLEKLENASQIYGVVEQFSRVTQDLQMSVLSTRMQPIKKVFDKIPRQVRELKTKLGKEVNLIIEGEMTEVDKTLVEELADPMVHMIRNALDHGLETPDERSAVGKHPEGTLVVRALYEGSNVVIRVQEDGRGIDPVKIRAAAVKKGIVTEEAARVMSDAEAVRLIMAPGFSTAEKITDVSGRGVGMDVVNTKILKMQGSIDIQSELGHGTCFSIYLPLTLAIVNALIVGASREGFAIPIGDIAEVLKFRREGMHRVNEQDIIELRGEPLPLFYLGKLTRTGVLPYNREVQQPVQPIEARDDLTLDELEHAVAMATTVPAARKQEADNGFVVVVRDGSSAMGLVVDELLGQEEVVVKGVTDMFQYHKAVSGATITGDGKVHMILDVPFMLKNLSAARA